MSSRPGFVYRTARLTTAYFLSNGINFLMSAHYIHRLVVFIPLEKPYLMYCGESRNRAFRSYTVVVGYFHLLKLLGTTVYGDILL